MKKKFGKKLLIIVLAIAIIISSLLLFKSCSNKNTIVDEVSNVSESTIVESTEQTEEVKEETTAIEEAKQEETKLEEVNKDKTTLSYWVNFVNKDGSILQRTTYKYGETPKYDGLTPTYFDGSYYYSFTGWDKAFSPVYMTQTYTALYVITGTVDKEICFGPQYKYEINQLANYLNIDGNNLQNMLLKWTNDSSNRNKSYTDLLNDIETRNDALCVAAIYILGTEHLFVSEGTLYSYTIKDIAKGILNSDVIFKNINLIFVCANDSTVSDNIFINYIQSNLYQCNDEILKVVGLDASTGLPVSDIYDAFKYSIDHASDEHSTVNIYNLTANVIYEILHLADEDIDLSLIDVMNSMNRMIAKSANFTIIDSQLLTQFGNKTEEEQKQLAYDYTIYCFMCVFGMISGNPSYLAMSNHFNDKVFTSLDNIGYALSSDQFFKFCATFIEAIETKNVPNIMITAYSKLLNGNIVSDFMMMSSFTDDYNEMYKAIGEIFNY